MPWDLLKQGVKSMTFRLAANFCISALNMPWRATIYPGKLTHTTSKTASKTSKTRWRKSGCEECGGGLAAIVNCGEDAEYMTGSCRLRREKGELLIRKDAGEVKKDMMSGLALPWLA